MPSGGRSVVIGAHHKKLEMWAGVMGAAIMHEPQPCDLMSFNSSGLRTVIAACRGNIHSRIQESDLPMLANLAIYSIYIMSYNANNCTYA